MTLSKIAKLAHVSVSTVSKAFSNSDEVNQHTKNEIFRIAKELGCFKKYYNAKYPKFVIAVICPEFKSSYYSYLLSIIENNLAQKNCDICVAQTNFSSEKEAELLNYYDLYTEVDGIIIIENYTNFKNYDIPIISIGSGILNSNFYTIDSDIKKPMMDVLEYFKSNNITEIGYIGEYKTTERFTLFKNCMKEYYGQVNDSYIFITPERFEEGGYNAAKALTTNGKLPQALFCAYANMAVGAIRYFNEVKIKVPEDIAVLGMDDIRENNFLTPSISAISIKPNEICKIACEQMLDTLNGNPCEENYIIDGEIIFRESTKIK